jgi:predicted RNA polymerase sigma factor
MSDRIRRLVITLKEPASEEYAERMMNAIRMISNVGIITPEVEDWRVAHDREEIRRQIGEEVWTLGRAMALGQPYHIEIDKEKP